MKKYVVAIILLSALLISACGRGTTTPPPDLDPYAPPPPVAGTYTPDPNYRPAQMYGNIHPIQDLQGQTITIASMGRNFFTFSGSGVNSTSISMMPADSILFDMFPNAFVEPDPATADNYPLRRGIWDNARRVERDFNFTIENVSESPVRLQTRLRTTAMSGEHFADIAILPPEIILAAAQGNWIVPLDTIDLPNSDLLGAQMYSRFAAEGLGHPWSFTPVAATSPAYTLGVNRDIIRAVGARCPVELYNAGEWTWDAWLEIMRRAAETDGFWGITGPPYALFMNMVAANDGVIVDDNFNFSMDHPNTIEAIEFMQQLMNEEIWQPERHHTGGTLINYDRGTTAFTTSVPWPFNFITGFQYYVEYDFAVVPLPTGPSNTTGNTGLDSWGAGYVLHQSANFEPATLLAILEEYLSWPEWDTQAGFVTYWGGTWTELANYDALRQANTATNMSFCYSRYISNVAERIDSFVMRLDPNHWSTFAPWYTIHDKIEYLRFGMQLELDRFFN